MPEELASWLSEQGDSMNQAIVDLLDNARYARMYALNELKNKFTEGEWLFFATSLNNVCVSGQFRYNKKGLIAHCEDSESLNFLASNNEVDINTLIKKIDCISAAQVEALYYRVEKYWNLADLPDDEVFDKEGKLENWEMY